MAMVWGRYTLLGIGISFYYPWMDTLRGCKRVYNVNDTYNFRRFKSCYHVGGKGGYCLDEMQAIV